jgi:hypothetical protein
MLLDLKELKITDEKSNVSRPFAQSQYSPLVALAPSRGGLFLFFQSAIRNPKSEID